MVYTFRLAQVSVVLCAIRADSLSASLTSIDIETLCNFVCGHNDIQLEISLLRIRRQFRKGINAERTAEVRITSWYIIGPYEGRFSEKNTFSTEFKKHDRCGLTS